MFFMILITKQIIKLMNKNCIMSITLLLIYKIFIVLCGGIL